MDMACCVTYKAQYKMKMWGSSKKAQKGLVKHHDTGCHLSSVGSLTCHGFLICYVMLF